MGRGTWGVGRTRFTPHAPRCQLLHPHFDAGAVGGQAFLGGEDLHVGGKLVRPCGLKSELLASRKSFAESPLAKRAVPLVGSTCDGPAA